jgi:hypothetical protein
MSKKQDQFQKHLPAHQESGKDDWGGGCVCVCVDDLSHGECSDVHEHQAEEMQEGS